MVRPLLEIEHPWLTRDQMEAAIWRLTEVRSAAAVEQLLRLSDVYAVSQGPSLIEKLRERDLSRKRWGSGWPDGNAVIGDRAQLRLMKQSDEKDDDPSESEPAELESELQLEPEPEPEPPSSDGPVLVIEGRPSKSAEVWKLPDGRMLQFCTGCKVPKDYDDFFNDKIRWNGKAGQCKKCRSKSKSKGRYKQQKDYRSEWDIVPVPSQSDLDETG